MNVGPAVLDLDRVYAGDDTVLLLTLVADGGPWDLTGATGEAQVRCHPAAVDVGLTAVVDILDPVAGEIQVTFDGEDVRTLLAGADRWKGAWDLQINNGTPQTVVAGKFSALMDVTRSP